MSAAPVAGLGRTVLGPFRAKGGSVLLRPPRFSDATGWREVRLTNQRVMEPFWPTSPRSWTERHTEAAWVREVVESRREARAGRQESFVIELDGAFVGQIVLSDLDATAASGEMGAWVDVAVARRGVAQLACAAVLDHAFDALGLRLVAAPVNVRNVPAAIACRRLGMVDEARLRGFFHAGGSWADHDLWVALDTDRPAGGSVADHGRRVGTDCVGASDGGGPLLRLDPLPRSPRGLLALGRYVAGRVRGVVRPRTRPGPMSWRLAGAGGDVVHGLRHVDDVHRSIEAYVDSPATLAEATEAIRRLLAHATGAYGAHRVTALTAPDDGVLRSAYEAAGLRYEGTLRSRPRPDGTRGDLELWAALADDPRP